MPVLPSLASKVAALPPARTGPLWLGPQAEGPFGGVTQSMLVRFLSCRERFRVRYVEGLQPPDAWNKTIGYGNMWHCAEEAHAGGKTTFLQPLVDHTQQMFNTYPLQREEITKWFSVCCVQFPEYVKYWSQHSDVLNRTPLMQEQVFDVPYMLPSGRVVRLRGKFDSVDLIEEQVTEFGKTFQRRGIYLQENKSKGDIDPMQLERQLKFDLQTMLYLVALWRDEGIGMCVLNPSGDTRNPIRGVRYNVVRRPLSGGIGSIKPHKATKKKPAETGPQFYERLRRDYIAADPAYWFFRIRIEVSAKDIMEFRTQCLDPILENLCWWYDTVVVGFAGNYGPPPAHWRHPFGVYNALEEGLATEYDAYLANGSTAGLRKTDVLFPELEAAV